MSPAAPERHADVLLVGGGVASARCARTLRRRGFDGSILLVGDEARPPYNRPPLSKELLRDPVPEELVAAEPSGWYARRSVELLSGARVVALEPDARIATLADGGRIRYGSCLLATGAVPRRPPIPGAERALLLRTFEDAAAIRAAAETAGHGARAVVIGGGFIGVEVAASLAGLGLRVTLLELGPAPWSGTLGAAVSAWTAARLEAAGVEVRLGAAATALDGGGVAIGDERIEAAIVVAGVGVRPRTELAEGAGLAVADGIVVDRDRRAAPGVYAAGDVARVPHPLAGGGTIRVEHWHAALEGGAAAALAILGEAVPTPRAPWVYSEFAGQLVDAVGWAPEHDDEAVLGDPATGPFCAAQLRGGTVVQAVVVNGYLPVDAARGLVERAASVRELERLAPA